MSADIQTAAPQEESDFSFRKMKIAFAILVGTLFGSSILPFMAIMLLTLPMTEEFGWSRTQFSGGLTAMMLVGGCSAPFLGRMVDKIGARYFVEAHQIAQGAVQGVKLPVGGVGSGHEQPVWGEKVAWPRREATLACMIWLYLRRNPARSLHGRKS